MKKLFTLLALLTCFLGANAVEYVDAEVDFSKYSDISEVPFASWRGSESAFARLSLKDGCLHFESTEATDPSWDCQFFPIGGVNAEVDVTYTLHFKIKGDHAGNVSMLGFGQTPYGQFAITTDWVEGTVDYVATSTDGNILMQCGDWVGSWDIAYLKITHEGKEERPVTWLENLTNGDASADWPAWSLETTEEGFNINWRGDRTGEICAWALTMGKNNDNLDGQDGRARPFPADIEEVDGSRVFVVNATQCAVIEQSPDDANSYQWANQFWIQSPKGWKSGTDIKLHFRYKASKAVTAATQIHKQHPSDYLIWHAIGDIAFTEEWKEYDGTFSFGDDMDGGWSVAFNLNANTPVDGYEPIKFYFDDLSWQNMQLDEGWFVAASNKAAGIDYDYDNAIEFEGPDDEGVFVATVGTVGKNDTWVNELMISTVRGNDKAFKGATIKPSGKITTDDPDNWQQYTAGSSYKISLPAAGVWQISIAPEDTEINFLMIEGDEPIILEPVDIVTNTTEMVVNATERDWKAEGEEEAGTGQPWDNQFWIAANRDLKKDEVTVVKFQYKATKAATASTQAHKVGDDGKPCTYLNWEAIGNVDFTEEWLPFEKTFTIPAGDDGMRSIVFNLSEFKPANDYYFKDVQWYLYDADLEAGKTYENLIKAEDTSNFWIKVDKGAPIPYGTDPSGITNVTAKKNSSAAIYNIAGQKVDKNFKGIVVMDGKKFVTK